MSSLGYSTNALFSFHKTKIEGKGPLSRRQSETSIPQYRKIHRNIM